MQTTVSLYSLADGLLTGAELSGSPEFVAENTPADCGAIDGQHDHTRRRIDLATGELVSYQPPAPASDEWQTWTWDAGAWRWLSVPTTAALARDARAERARRLLACDWTQLPDVPTWTAQAWATYRQHLRDITAQAGFPSSIAWPEEPTP
jgi:hypothetical protein